MINNALEQFEETFQLFTEVTSNQAPASGAIRATDSPPRKDFGPVGGNGYPPSMPKKGLLDPYQQHPYSNLPDPERPVHLPYPLETVHDYLSNSYVYLKGSITQIDSVINNNLSLDPVFKAELKKIKRTGLDALKKIYEMGMTIDKAANLNY